MATATSQASVAHFCMLAKGLLKSLKELFPECEKTDSALATLELLEMSDETREMLVNEWNKNMSPFYDACRKKDERMLLGAGNLKGFLEQIDMEKKWVDPTMTDDNKAVFWMWLVKLNQTAAAYANVSPDEQQGIMGLMNMVKDQIQPNEDGNITINPAEILNSLTSSQEGAALLDTVTKGIMQGDAGGLGNLMAAFGGAGGAGPA